jgi:hypothetical protein
LTRGDEDMARKPKLSLGKVSLAVDIHFCPNLLIQNVQLKSGLYFNMSSLFTKIYNILYYTTNLYLQ